MTDAIPELVQFFKALADETRLKIVGLLARESYSGEQLAAILDVKPATISHHLARLAEAGLVSAEADGHFKLYALRLDAIHSMAGRLLAKDTLPQTAADLDVEAYDRKVVKGFSKRDGSLKEIPAQQKKLLAVLRHIVKEFKPGREYSEKEVNEILARFHEDTASLRREMVGHKLMQRASGRYWRSEE
jgi:biotin operon repressor